MGNTRETLKRIHATRATITKLKSDPVSVKQYSKARLENVLDNLDPEYDHEIGSLVRNELEKRDGLFDY